MIFSSGGSIYNLYFNLRKDLKMKSKLVVLAVLSTLSMSAIADDVPVDFDLIPGVDIGVLNGALNTAEIDVSIVVDAEGDIALSQNSLIELKAEVEVEVEAGGSATDVTSTTTNTTALVENIGNSFKTNGIGAIVTSDVTINTALNTSSSFSGEASLEAELSSRELEIEGELEFDSNISSRAPDVLVANLALNFNDIRADFTMNSGADMDLENVSVSTNGIGAAVTGAVTLNLGTAGLPQ